MSAGIVSARPIACVIIHTATVRSCTPPKGCWWTQSRVHRGPCCTDVVFGAVPGTGEALSDLPERASDQVLYVGGGGPISALATTLALPD